ncbi:MAG: hypothetical protein LBO77_09120 [Desulfovibrio sp.]|jgi:hypothetical protein|nr:hypothetical protein [Desulfovibrio sp.]
MSGQGDHIRGPYPHHPNEDALDKARLRPSTLSPALLKILSGLHAGAEMELGAGDWVLGSGEESDLIITDAGVAPRHVLLRIMANGEYALTPQDDSVWVAGASVAPVGQPLPPFAVFSVGGVHMALGHATDAWPALCLPSPVEPPSSGKETARFSSEAATIPEKTVSRPGAGDDRTGGRDIACRDTSTLVGSNFVGGETSNKVHVTDRLSGMRRNLPRLALLFLALLLLMGLLLDFTSLGLFFSVAERDAKTLASNLQTLGFSKVSVSVLDDKRLLARGVVENNARLNALAEYVENHKLPLSLQVISLEDLSLALEAQSRRADAAIRVSRFGASIGIHGYSYDMEAFHDLFSEEQDMLDQASASAALRISVRTWPEAKEELERLLNARNFAGRYALTPDRFHIRLRLQSLTPDELRHVHSLMREVNDYFGVENVLVVERWSQSEPQGKAESSRPPEPLSASVPPALFPASAPRVESCGDLALTGEGAELAVLYHGSVYRAGAKLPGNLHIRVITPAYVVLQEGSTLTRICNAVEMAKE